MRKLTRWGGPAAMLGGVFWMVGAIVTALKPEGCVADECYLPGRSMREGSTLHTLLSIAAVLLIGLGMTVVVARVRDAGRFGRVGHIGLVATIVGGTLLLAGVLVQALFFGGDFPYMPFVVIPGLLVVIIGVLLLGIAILLSAVLPRWAGALLAVGALSMLAFNDQNARAFLAIPFGIAWVAVGYVLWAEKSSSPAA